MLAHGHVVFLVQLRLITSCEFTAVSSTTGNRETEPNLESGRQTHPIRTVAVSPQLRSLR